MKEENQSEDNDLNLPSLTRICKACGKLQERGGKHRNARKLAFLKLAFAWQKGRSAFLQTEQVCSLLQGKKIKAKINEIVRECEKSSVIEGERTAPKPNKE